MCAAPHLGAQSCTSIINQVASIGANQDFAVTPGEYVTVTDASPADTVALVWNSGSPVTGVNGVATGYAPTGATSVDVSIQVSGGGSSNYGYTFGTQCPGALNAFVITTTNASPASAGVPFNVTVKAVDYTGATASGYQGTIQFTSTDTGATLPANYTFTGGDAGVHTFTNGASMTLPGTTTTINATDTTQSIPSSVLTGTSGNITVVPGPVASYTASAPSAVAPGVPFSVSLSAFDKFNNAATNYTGTVHFTTSDNGVGSVVPSDYTFTGGDAGSHTFTNGFTLETAGAQTIGVKDTVLTSATGSVQVGVAEALTVTTTADSGTGSLRAVITNGNAFVGGAVISFSVTGTITLGSALPAITNLIYLNGPGANQLAIDGNNQFQILNNQGQTVSLSGLTFQNGKNTSTSMGGGAIYNSGSLSVTACAFTGNTDPASGSGGAIDNDSGATLIVSNSTFSGNTATGTSSAAGFGGAIFDAGNSASITESTFNGNSATDPNGKGSGGGGAIFSSSGALTVRGGTISGNSQSGNAAGDTGGGVFATTPSLTNTIVAKNTSIGAPDLAASVTAGSSNNLIGDGTGMTGITNGTNGNQVGTSGSPIDPLLRPLASNGGPTQTMLPFTTSPVLGAGTTSGAPSTDQRGYGRTVSSAIDIGAVEFQGLNLNTTSGSGQSTTISTAFASPLVATATESTSNTALNGESVTFAAPNSGASATLSSNLATTDASGQASITATANSTTGSYNVSAALGAGTTSFSLTNNIVVVPATHFQVTAAGAATAGTSFGVTVTALTAGNTTATSYTGTIHFTATDPSVSVVLPANYTFVAGDNGVHTFTNGAMLITAGSQTITTTDSANSLTGTSNSITVIPAATSHLSVSAPVSTTAGVSFTVTVTALDPFGNAATGFQDTIQFTSSDGNPGVTLPSNYTFVAGDNGVHTFANGVTLATAGSRTVTATDLGNGAISGTSAISVSAAAATHLSIVAPASTSSGTPFTATVTAFDPFNNMATGYRGTIHFTSTDTGAGISIPANYTFVAGNNGTHTFTGVTLVTSGTQTITAVDTNLLTGTSNSITVSAGPATHFSVSGPGSTVKGNTFSLTVTALDANNNTAGSYIGTVTFSSTDGAAILPTNATLFEGMKTFNAALNTAGNQTITATDTVDSSITGTTSTISIPTPAIFMVTSTLDPVVPSTGTLRNAIGLANASGTGATIDMTGVSGTITLTSGALPQLAQSMTLIGPGAASLAVSGNNAVQVFSVASGISVSISGLTVANGLSTDSATGGGGIYNNGTLSLSSCAITGNQETNSGHGGGIFNDAGASLNISNCTIANNLAGGPSGSFGGGLFSEGNVIIFGSTFSGNTAAGGSQPVSGGGGGAIYTTGNTTIVGSTVSGNSATDPNNEGGSEGGAILNLGALVVRNSTIALNSQTGTGGQGGGVETFQGAGRSASLTDTILAGNIDAGDGRPDGSGQFIDGGNNLIGNSNGVSGISNGVNGNIVGTSGSPINPQLGALQNNGGPTQTMLPLFGSPALGAGSTANTTVSTDQRGFARTVSGQVDIGAVEFQGVNLSASGGATQTTFLSTAFPSPLQVTATENASGIALSGTTVTYAAPNSGASATLSNAGSAITDSSGNASVTATANAIAGGPYTVTASLGTGTATFSLTNAALLPTHFTISAPGSAITGIPISITVSGLTSANTTATAYVGTVHFSSTDGAAVLPADYTFTGGDAGVHTFQVTLKTAGGQTLTATDTVMSAITGTSNGITTAAPIPLTVMNLNDSGAGSLRAAIMVANASPSGGAITFSVTGTITLATALPQLTQSMTITGPGASSLAVSGNNAVQVFNVAEGITVGISGLTIENGLSNSGGTGGGGIYNAGNLNLSQCVVTGNRQTDLAGGGGIFNVPSGNLNMSQCAVTSNQADAGPWALGGGLLNSGAATITNSTFSGNTAIGGDSSGGHGGAIYNDSASPLAIIGSTIANNTVTDPQNRGGGLGGGIFSDGTLVFKNSTISGNSQAGTLGANDAGGGIFASGTAVMTNTVLAGNTSAGVDADGVGTFTSSSNNIVGDGTNITGIVNGVNGNQVGTSGSPISPQLSALANNGGPTQTMLPSGSSPVLSAGNTTGAPSTDQRGFARVVNSVMDIGAVQLQGISLTASAGDAQSTSVSAAFTTALAAKATESCGGCTAVVPGVSVTFTAPTSGATGAFANSTNTTSATTGSDGIATATAFTANAISGGPYNVSASGTTPDQATAASVNFGLTNSALSQFITFSALSDQTYGVTAFAISASASSTLGVNLVSTTPGVCSVSGGMVTVSGAGPCSITASQGGNQSYAAAAPVIQGFTVNKAGLTITANNDSKSYGQVKTYGAGSAAFTNGTLFNGDTVTSVTISSTGAAAAAGVGGSPYAIVPSLAVGTGLANYSISYTNGSLAVNQANLTITANNDSKTYGQTKNYRAGSTAFTTGTMFNSDAVTSVTLSSTGAAATATVAGSPYPIVPSVALGTGLGNYNISYANGGLTVSVATLTITANNDTKTYGQAKAYGAGSAAFSTNGLVNSDSVTGVTLSSTGAAANAAVAGSPYMIVPSAAVGTGLANYSISYTNGTLSVSRAVLTVTANSFTIDQGSALPTFTAGIAGFVNGENTSAVTGAPQLTLNGSQPACSGSVPITAAAGSLAAANYSFTFVSGTLSVNAPAPTQSLALVSGNAQIGEVGTALAPLLVQASSSGCGALSPSNVQVTFSVSSGSASIATMTVYTDSFGMAQTTITPMSAGVIAVQAVSGFGSVQFTETSLPASLAPGLQALPSRLSFTATVGGTNPAAASLDVINSGVGFLNWTASVGSASWLSVTPAGTTPSAATVTADIQGLAANTYTGTVTLTAGASKATVPVTLTVLPAGAPAFTFAPSSITVTAQVGSSIVSQSLAVGNAGAGSLNWTATANTVSGGWLGLSSNSGTAPDKIAVELNPAGLAAGEYTGSVQFSGPGGVWGAVNVIFDVTALLQLTSTTPMLQFTASTGSGASTQSIAVGTSSGATIAISAAVNEGSSSNWLTATAPANAPGTISVTATPGSLAAGSYSGYVLVSSAGASNTLVVPVTLDLGGSGAPGTLTATPGGVILTGNGIVVAQNVSVSSNGSTAFSWSTAVETTGGNWLSASAASGNGNGNGSFTISAFPGSLAPGSYTGQVVVTATGTTNGSLIIPVTLVVPGGGSPVLQVTSPATQFTGATGTPLSLQAMLVSSTGTPMTGATIQASFSDGEPLITLTDTGGGNYAGSWTPQVAGAIAIAFSGPSGTTAILSGSIASGSLPVIFRGGAVGSALTLSGPPLSAGGMGTLYGTNFLTQTLSAPSLPLPLSLGGFSMTINGIPVPLYYVSSGQINFFVPWELAGVTQATIQLTTPTGVFDVGNVPVAPQAPGVFTVDAANDPAATDLAGQLITSSAPAHAGQIIVLYVSSLGPVSNPPTDGAASPENPPSADLITPVVTIGGINAQVLFAGLTPTLAGLYQIDVTIPSQVPSGPTTVTITAGGFASPPVQIQVQ